MKLLKIDGSILIEGDCVSIKELLEKNRDADLRCADLECANLRGANLEGAKYEEIEIKNTIITITNLDYFCLIFSGYIKLGCKIYKVEEWENFTDEEIIKMDGKNAIKFWKKWKNVLIEMCKEENEPQEE